MAKREKPDRGLTLAELMQHREYLEREWPDLEKKDDNWYKSLDKLAIHLPEWVLAVVFLAGILIDVYFSYLIIGLILITLCIGLVTYRRGIERGCVQGFREALDAVQRAIDQEGFSEDCR